MYVSSVCVCEDGKKHESHKIWFANKDLNSTCDLVFKNSIFMFYAKVIVCFIFMLFLSILNHYSINEI